MKLNKKGMTLFELLAVIVILGIVAAITFPTVNNLLNNAKKDTFSSNANLFAQTAITEAVSYYTTVGITEEIAGAGVDFTYYAIGTDDPLNDYDFDISGDIDNTNLVTAEVVINVQEDGTTSIKSITYKNADYEITYVAASVPQIFNRSHVIDVA
ncbi:MAG: Type pilin PilA [Haloplasmataceae bacterium]|jgi:type IV pilus assembly protein PilA|nr:Type pilin PilA [Haloplasmataceae bacterium]